MREIDISKGVLPEGPGAGRDDVDLIGADAAQEVIGGGSFRKCGPVTTCPVCGSESTDMLLLAHGGVCPRCGAKNIG